MRYTYKRCLVGAVAILVLSLIPLASQAQGHGSRMSSIPGLQQYPLSVDQKQQIAQIRAQGRQDVQQVRRDPNLSAQEKADRIAQIRSDTHSKVMDVLTPEQKQEFQTWWSVQRESRGAGAGAGPTVTMGPVSGSLPGLKNHPLSQEQMDRIQTIRMQHRQQMRDVQLSPDLSRAEKLEHIRQIRDDQHQAVMDVLTPDQKQEFSDWWSSHSSSQ